MFWELTPQEVYAVLQVRREEERQATLRAGLIAATIVNVNRKPGARLVQPHDFIREPPRVEDFMDADEAFTMMDRWAAMQNAAFAAEEQMVGSGIEDPAAVMLLDPPVAARPDET